ncbi:hypothetical protein ONZ45_g289 [Pleurotus djamor]|nr:hypothetical protein ONZ45_g289 [Pleurotus djamor]
MPPQSAFIEPLGTVTSTAHQLLQYLKPTYVAAAIGGPPLGGILVGQFLKIIYGEAGIPQREWVKEHGSAVRVVGPIGIERLIFLKADTLHKILVSEWMEYPRPTFMREILGFVAGYGLLTVTGSEHKRMRKAMVPAFSISNLMAQIEMYYEPLDSLVKIIKYQIECEVDPSGGKVIPMYEWMSKVTLDIICETAFGYKTDSLNNPHNELAVAYETLLNLQSGPVLARFIVLASIPGFKTFINSEWLWRNRSWVFKPSVLQPLKTSIECMRYIKKLSEQMVQEKLRDTAVAPSDTESKRDIMSLLVRARQAEPEQEKSSHAISDEEMMAQLTFLGAGHETTASGLAWTLWLLACHKDVQEELRNEVRPVYENDPRPDYRTLKDLPWLDGVVMEALRLFPPVPMTFRQAAKTDYIEGIEVPKGTLLYIPIRVVNTWKDIWGENAEEFYPPRWKSLPKDYTPTLSFLSFIAGPHACIGKTMAIMEMKAVLASLIANFSFEPAYEGQVSHPTAAVTMIGSTRADESFIDLGTHRGGGKCSLRLSEHDGTPGRPHSAHEYRPSTTNNQIPIQGSWLTPRKPSNVPPPPLEIEPLSISGPTNNRADLVFFSDGYLPEERGKFFNDAKRLAQDISGNQTFFTVKPLLNFWAAFSPSNESGIGVGGKPKDTPFGLYRDGTELRGVYYAKEDVALSACGSLGDQCDHAILLGNDPLYGGLGGQFTVITSSLANGPLVLRHELGHSIIGVGEEYDGGFAYFGPNAAHNISEPLPWSQWLSHPNPESNGTVRAERSAMPFQAYPWTILNTTSPWITHFTSSGTYSRHLIRFSLSGLPEASDITVELDGIDLGWVPQEDIGVDRWHYDIHRSTPLTEGTHQLKFTLVNKDREGTAQLCSAEVLEFGSEEEFSETNTTSYRPTNEDCLMRIVTATDFCKACIEGLWLALLSDINLIDNFTQSCVVEDGQTIRSVGINLLPVAQFRESPTGVSEAYEVIWTKDGVELERFANQTVIQLQDTEALGNYTVNVAFITEEVRVDPKGDLRDMLNFTVTERCLQ